MMYLQMAAIQQIAQNHPKTPHSTRIEPTALDRRRVPELADVESFRFFATKTGVLFVCLVTDRQIRSKSR